MTRRYRIVYTRTAEETRRCLDDSASAALDETLKRLRRDPFAGEHDPKRDSYTLTFANGWGLIEYAVHEHAVVISVIRLVWTG